MTEGRIAFRRIVLALTPDGASDAALRSAAELARLLGVRLQALFLEEEAALQAADLGFGAEVTLSGAPRRIDRASVEADFERLARRLQRRLDAAAQAARLSCGFERLRGAPAERLSAALEAGDMAALFEPPGAGDRAMGPHASLRRAALAGVAAALLSPPRQASAQGGVVALAAAEADAAATAFAESVAAGLGARLQRLAGAPGVATSGGGIRLLIVSASLPAAEAEALLGAAARTHTPALSLARATPDAAAG